MASYVYPVSSQIDTTFISYHQFFLSILDIIRLQLFLSHKRIKRQAKAVAELETPFAPGHRPETSPGWRGWMLVTRTQQRNTKDVGECKGRLDDGLDIWCSLAVFSFNINDLT